MCCLINSFCIFTCGKPLLKKFHYKYILYNNCRYFGNPEKLRISQRILYYSLCHCKKMYNFLRCHVKLIQNIAKFLLSPFNEATPTWSYKFNCSIKNNKIMNPIIFMKMLIALCFCCNSNLILERVRVLPPTPPPSLISS